MTSELQPGQGLKEPTANRTMPFESVAGRVVAGLVLAVALLFGIGGWAAMARISSAVIAHGSVRVDQNLKQIQHRDGGIVSSIDVREGDVVQEGQVLLKLEDTQSKAELSILHSQLIEAEARRARLLAERDGMPLIDFPARLSTDDAATGNAIAGEIRLHSGNIANRVNQRRQLELTIEQIGEEISGLTAQRKAMEEEIVLLTHSQEKLQSLVEKGLAETPRVEALQREQVQLRGRLGDLDASIARSRARIGEMNMRILAIEEVARTEAQRELVQIETRVSELTDRIAAVSDRLARTEIRSPIAGTVNEMNVFTIGGVITPAEILATIVPQNARLRIEVRISPTSIDQVRLGQPARIRFTAFNHRTTPEVEGRVVQISPATTQDQVTGEPFYTCYVDLLPGEAEKLGTLSLVPGMPTEIYLPTEEQTALAYLAKPVLDQFERALREE